MDASTSILIIGAGAFGTSTAYHLSLRGYRNVTVLDKHPLPSVDAAATDISKIIRSDYNEPLYARLGLEAIEAWSTDQLYAGLYHVPGWILAAKELSVPFVEGSVRTAERLGVKGIQRLTREEVKERWKVVSGDLNGWNINVWNPSAGWANAGEALERMGRAAQDNGVEFVTGVDGAVDQLVYDRSGVRCIGARVASGKVYKADLVVLAAGAWTPWLLDCGGQLTAKGHCVAHIQMNRQEAQRYKDFPIMDNLELGYYFPPNQDHVFKMAHGQFITNTRTNDRTGVTTSTPHTFIEHPQDQLPAEIERTMRRNLRRVLPELENRPFSFTRLCWDADSKDRHFVVTSHPQHNGLVVAGGGSAHGFKFLPVLGRYVCDLLEGKLEDSIRNAWRWRPEQNVGKKDLAHMEPELELKELSGWNGSRRRAQNERVAKL